VQLPYAEEARVPKAKITEFLLDPEHEYAGPRAAFFIERGFRVEAWELLAEALREHAVSHDVAETADRKGGTNYVIEGRLRIPGGGRTNLPVRTVWKIDMGSWRPRLITAHPVSS
jgi:hypothetical protein